MKRVLLAVAAISTLAAASTATAQPYRGGGYGPGGSDGRQLEQRIEWASRNGTLSWREARSLRAQVDDVQRLEWRYRQNGISGWEARDLDRRYDDIRRHLRWERNDRDRTPGQRYGEGYGWR